MVAPKREDAVRRTLIGDSHPGVGRQPLPSFFDGDLAVKRDREVRRMHVLTVELQRRAEHVQVVPHRLEDMMCIAGVMRAESLDLVSFDRGAGNVVGVLADVIGSAQTKEPTIRHMVGAVCTKSEVLSNTAMLWVLHETMWRYRSDSRSSASSLIPRAYILPNPNSEP